jgi:acid phosphatase family membrane protein YuiD
MVVRTEADALSLFASPVFLSAFFSWFIAQLLKTIIDIFRRRRTRGGLLVETLLWKTGGMPSSHSALVTALAVAIGFQEGINSSLFGLSLFYGMLIIRDAMGVRRAAGLQARAINAMGSQLRDTQQVEFTPVKEVHGHTPMEVVVGILLGLFIALGFSIL